jgi:hypothetical protein
MTASESCGTPPYPLPQQYFYNNEAGGLTAEQYALPNGNLNNYTNEIINQQQMLQYEYEQSQQQYGNGNCGYYCEDNNNLFEQQILNNNGRRSSASTFNNNIVTVGNGSIAGGGVYCPSLQC